MMDGNLERFYQNTGMIENSLIGSVLIDSNLLNEIDLIPEQFYFETTRLIFNAIASLHAAKQPVDLITVTDWLANKNNVDLFADVASIAKNSTSAASGKAYAEKVKEYWRSREAARIATDLQSIQSNNDPALIDKAIRELMTLNTTSKKYSHTAPEVVDSSLQEIQRAQEQGGSTALQTNMLCLDYPMGGLNQSDLIVVAARPAMGKTAFLLNAGTQNPDVNMGLISAEQSHVQIGKRLFSIHGNVSGALMRKGQIVDEDFTNLVNASAKLYDYGFHVNDKPGINIDDIERQARKWVHEYGINMLGVDYLQKIRHPNAKLNTTDRVADIAIRLKDLGKELNIPVVALAQVNRSVDDRSDKRPEMSDIKDCGVIEQEADIVITLYRDSVYSGNEKDNTAEIIYRKNRHGPTGTQYCNWVGKYFQFQDRAKPKDFEDDE